MVVETDGSDLPITEDHVRHLCEDYLADRLDELEIAYVASALELCPDFRCTSSTVEEAVFRLAGPEINGKITREIVREIFGELG